jgi:uncharacterized membrane protein (UPF0127 family)
MRRSNAHTPRKFVSWSMLPLSLFLLTLFLSACDSIPAPPSTPTATTEDIPTPTLVAVKPPPTVVSSTPVPTKPPTVVDTPVPPLPATLSPTPVLPTPIDAATAAVNPQFSTPDPLSLTPWVPPTALAGTPIPGAVATLTAAPRLPTGTLTILNAAGEKVLLRVEIAGTEPSRELGLMFRDQMAPNAGMLFDFGVETTSGFWMQNTILPLSIAFIKADGTIINIADMQPLDTTIIPASGAYSYALEANQGFFTVHNIVTGSKALLPVVPDK